jgi:hypothetical protein
MSDYEVTELNRVTRLPNRGHYDRETIHRIIDEALICHVAFVADGQPFIIPTIHARTGDTIILHGAKANRMLRHIEGGNRVCIGMTLLDGIVFARSVFHHSMNYRSVVLFGTGSAIEADEEKLRALELLTEKIARGRWKEARLPTTKELAATSVISVTIETASAKIRTGPPKDDEEDYSLPVWAGVLPLALQPLQPITDPNSRTTLPPSVTNYCISP